MSLTYYVTRKQIASTKQRTTIGEREREEVHLESEEECRRMEYLQEQERKAREEVKSMIIS